MKFRHAARLAVAALLITTGAASAGQSIRQAPVSRAPASSRLLDVPYLAQTADLCGGAAVAMVLRYWGERQVYAEDFAALVDRSASGIATDVLTREVSRRGWQTLRIDETAPAAGESIRDHIDRGRPVIALIEIAPGRYHYVVIVAWTADRVIIHDPARSPFRVLARDEFERAWAPAGHWALLILPATNKTAPRTEATTSSDVVNHSSPNQCTALVDTMVARSLAGDQDGAATGLAEAIELCPDHAAAWRELAGVRFLQSRWAEASELASRAAALDPGDQPGWDLLATSHFLNDEPGAALASWNKIGRPAVDVVRIEGRMRTRQPVVSDILNLRPRMLLTPESLALAARRLQDLPSAAQTRLSYRPLDGGIAEVEAVVVEHALPHGLASIAAVAGRSWLERELRLDVAAPTGSGELWTAAWRWWDARPRVAFGLALPAPGSLPGVVTVSGSWERQSYSEPLSLRTERRRASFGLADWADSTLHWNASAALDRFADRDYLSADAAFDRRLARDRVSIGVEAAAWMPLASGLSFVSGNGSAAWRSSRDGSRPFWQVTSGVSLASAGAPFDIWNGAGAEGARGPLLRAHPLLDRGVVVGEVFGRGLSHATVEYQHPVMSSRVPGIRLAAFTDLARAWRLMDGSDSSRLQADAGVGIRVALPGAGGTARLDVGRGLRDGAMAFSAGWLAPWPGR